MSQAHTHLLTRQEKEVERVKEQGIRPIRGLLENPPFSYDPEMAVEISNDLIDGMELHLNAAKSTAEVDVDMVNRLGKDLSSLYENAILCCIIDQEADPFDPESLKLRDDKEPLILFQSKDINAKWPGDTENFALTKMVTVGSYIELAVVIATFLEQVALPHNKWSSWIANIVVIGCRDGVGITLKDCPNEVLDIPSVLDFVDSFKKRTAQPTDLNKPNRGPYAARVLFSHNTVDKKYPIKFGFKQYIDHNTEDIPTEYICEESILVHPDDERYMRQVNEANGMVKV